MSAKRFAAALRDPEETQRAWLMRRLAADAGSSFGREHGFEAIRSYRDFVRSVPLGSWDDFAPWIERIRSGENDVLSTGRVTHLAPTSGSSGARKLIPFTRPLHTAFAGAVGAWMADLVKLSPGSLLGPAYWSISPLADEEEGNNGAVPVGFADDAEYLGGWKAGLARWAMAVPAGLRHERNMEEFWFRTAFHLLAQRDLRLISVWHPSFLELILQAAERNWSGILGSLGKRRAAELRRIGPGEPPRWWPGLRVISCWGDLAAEAGARGIARMFPRCLVQSKGLLATEAVVTIPWRGRYPLAVGSHFFEFLDEAGEVLRAHQLKRGARYEVVVTNGGGLWRYRLGDLVECTGHCALAPTLRFLGRAGNVSDLCGEKLSEGFVAETLSALWPVAARRPRTAFLRAFADGAGAPRYELVVGEETDPGVTERLDELLRLNPHYSLARKLGQLDGPVLRVDPDTALQVGESGPRRLGDIKPQVLVRLPGP